MTELQQIELNILSEFVRICDELNLKYYLVCGSALGAAKYQGFIPWDDDIDVALPREDYRVFCEKAQQLLPEYLFLQNHSTDPMYPLNFSKLRDSRTTYIEKSMSKISMNHGVYIDVFPLDGYPKSIYGQRQIEREKKRYGLSRLCCLNIPLNWKTFILVKIEKFFGLHKNPKLFVQRFEDCVSKYSVKDSDIWCNHGNWQGSLEYAEKSQYGEGVWRCFEGLRVRIPQKYDEYLTQKYGKWREDIPENQKVGHHYYVVCDLHTSYIHYFLQETSKGLDE